MGAQLATTTTDAVIPAFIAAAASIFCAALLAWVAFRAQSAHEHVEQIRRIIEENGDEIVEKLTAEIHDRLDASTRALVIADVVRVALREVLREYVAAPVGRIGKRWYDR